MTNSSSCSCGSIADGLVKVERDENGALLDGFECRPCAANQVPRGGAECIDCPALHMVASLSGVSWTCQCPAAFTSLQHFGGFWGRDESCMYSAERDALDTPTSYDVLFNELLSGGASITVDSVVVKQLLLPSATECLHAINLDRDPAQPRRQSLLAGNQACQAVGNLCVLYDYDENSAPCQLFDYLKAQSSTEVDPPAGEEWMRHLPGLYYDGPGLAATSRVAPALPHSLALPSDTGSRLRFLVAAYTLNGTFLGLRDLSDQLQLCPGGAADPSAYLHVGTDMEVSCDVPIAALLRDLDDVTFFDLYLYHDASSPEALTPVDQLSAGTLHPIPLRVRNHRINAQAINRNDISLDDQLTRRFYVIDAVSGAQSASEMPRAVRYLRSAQLTIVVKSNDDMPTQMLPPLLDVEYADLAIPIAATSPLDAEAELARQGASAPSRFRMLYTMEFDNSNDTINNLFVIAIVMWVLGSFFSAYLLIRRNQAGQFADYHRILFQICGAFATTFFFLLYIITTWWMLLYKGQRTLYFLMPDAHADGLYYVGLMPFQVFISCLFGAKCVHMIDLLLVQTRHDLFFIDWEQPRSGGGGGGASSRVDEEHGSGGTGAAPVSVWRTIFVANEWVKLQDARTVSTEISLFTLLFVQEGLGLGDSVRLVPHGEGDESVPEHMLFRFALSSGLLLAASLAQYLWMWAIWHRYVKDRVWQFVDLLAITNISCLLLEERHFGFYLHGRSVHDHADADMAQLNAHLKLEAESLVTTRGFTADSIVQTYDVYLSRRMREKYDAAFMGLLYSDTRRPPPGRRRAGAATGRGAAASGRAKGFRAAPEEGVQRQRELNRYLMGFLSTPTHTAGGGSEGQARAEKPIVRRKLGSERYGLPPDMGFGERSIFLEDTSGRFKRLLLAGREYDVVLFVILTYALFDMATGNTYVALFFAYAFDKVLGALRSELASRNIATKTLLDDRFLL